MKHITAATLAALALAGAAVPATAADVGVSIGISQPGVHGRIDIGRFPHPVLVEPRPVWLGPPHLRERPAPEPVYMWVPPGHRKHWRQHCGRYGACGAPVYFVQDRWYHQHVAPAPQPQHRQAHRPNRQPSYPQHPQHPQHPQR